MEINPIEAHLMNDMNRLRFSRLFSVFIVIAPGALLRELITMAKPINAEGAEIRTDMVEILDQFMIGHILNSWVFLGNH